MVAAKLTDKITDVDPEDRLSFATVAKKLGCHVGTVWRYRFQGVRGVRLHAYLIGGKRVTEKRFVDSFLAAINAPRDGSSSPTTDAADDAAFERKAKAEKQAALQTI